MSAASFFTRPMQMDGLGPPLRRLLLTLVMLSVLAGCSTSITRTPLEPELYFKARVPDYPDARFFGDKPLPDHAFDVELWKQFRLDVLKRVAGPGQPLQAHLLLLSGGGADGAFGAGVLNGWTAFGDRPEFEIVTGVSIGALMAPFAFLGADYDAPLRDMFLSRNGIDDIIRLRVFEALTGALAVGDSTPLAKLIEQYVDDPLLDAIAAEHRKGRRLFVGTTNLDARRPIVWNMGAIAASSSPNRLALFRDVLRASSAVPGLSQPVFINVELDGRIYQEMHVDGGVMHSLFLAVPTVTEEMRLATFGDITPTMWIIQNNKLRASYGPAEASLRGILSDTVSELIRAQSRGDQARLYFIAERERFNYRLAAVPRSFNMPGGDDFDPEYMRTLYAVGEDLARNGYPWRDAPSSLERLDIIDSDQ
ncbi:MAG: patatin-like phospholipase family protein [Pseudomonadota bacterium]